MTVAAMLLIVTYLSGSYMEYRIVSTRETLMSFYQTKMGGIILSLAITGIIGAFVGGGGVLMFNGSPGATSPAIAAATLLSVATSKFTFMVYSTMHKIIDKVSEVNAKRTKFGEWKQDNSKKWQETKDGTKAITAPVKTGAKVGWGTLRAVGRGYRKVQDFKEARKAA